MSIHERDWYREDYADKNGLRYDRRTATYAAKDQHVDASISVDELPSSDGPARVSPHWSLQLVVWLVLALALAAFFRYSR